MGHLWPCYGTHLVLLWDTTLVHLWNKLVCLIWDTSKNPPYLYPKCKHGQAAIKYFSYFERGTEAKILLQEFVFHDGSYPPLKMRFSPENIHYFLEITYFPKELKQNYQKIHHPSKAYCEIHI